MLEGVHGGIRFNYVGVIIREEKWRLKKKPPRDCRVQSVPAQEQIERHAIILYYLPGPGPIKPRRSPFPSLPSHTHQQPIPIRPFLTRHTPTDIQPQQRRQQHDVLRRNHRAYYLFPAPSIADQRYSQPTTKYSRGRDYIHSHSPVTLSPSTTAIMAVVKASSSARTSTSLYVPLLPPRREGSLFPNTPSYGL